MRLTPLDIQQQTFKVAFRGYDREEVAGFLERIRRQYEAIVRENVEITTRMNQVLDALGDSRARIEALEDRLGDEVEDALSVPEIELADGFDAGDLALWAAEADDGDGDDDGAVGALNVAARGDAPNAEGDAPSAEGDAPEAAAALEPPQAPPEGAPLPHEVPMWTPELAESVASMASLATAGEPLSTDDEPGVVLEFRPDEAGAVFDAAALSALSEVAESLRLLDGDPDALWTLEGLSDEAVLDAEREAAELVLDAEREAERIRAEARAQARAVVEEARLRADRILGEAQDELDMIDREIVGLTNQRDRLYRSLRHIVEDQARLLETFDELEAHFYGDYDDDAPDDAPEPRRAPRHDTEEAEMARWPEVLSWEVDEDTPPHEVGPTALERKVLSGAQQVTPPGAEGLDAG